MFTAVLLAVAAAQDVPRDGKLLVYVGTYTGPKSQGVYRMTLDLATGKLSAAELAAKTVNPSFVAVHPGRRFLYAVSEVASGKAKSGGVSAFAIEDNGDLKFLNTQPSKGGGPCHVVVDKDGKNVLVANYGGGSVAVIPVGMDGRLGEPTGFAQHEGKSVNKQRQEGPHAHSINLDPAGRFAFAADLGLDKVLVYRFDADKGTVTAAGDGAVEPGSGPRHLAFHPSGKFAYVINELSNTVTGFAYDADKGTLKPLEAVTTLPKDVKGNSYTAEVVVHPSGKFLYGSNRGHDSIAVFKIDETTGKLTAAGHTPTQGKTPRNFAIDPTGQYLLAANQGTHTVAVFQIDAKTGVLAPTGQLADVPAPVCVRFVPLPLPAAR